MGIDRSLYNDCLGWWGVYTNIRKGCVAIFWDLSMDWN